MKREGFVIYKSFYEPLKILPDEKLGKLFRAIFEYQVNGVEDVDIDIRMAFEFFKNQFRLDDEKYQKIIDRNKINGSKGGRPKQTQGKPNIPVGLEKPKKADKDKEKDKEKDKDKDFNIYGEFNNVKLSHAEYKKLEKNNMISYIEKLSSYMASKNKKYKSHYATILTWARKDKPKENIPEWFDQDIKKTKNENEEELKNMIKEFE